jgi:transposase
MAYREHGMWEVLEVLRRAHRGERQRAISRTTGRSRKTIRRYLKVAGKLGWRPGQEEPDEPLAARVQARLRPGPPEVGPSDSEYLLEPHRDQIQQWLSGEGDGGRLKLTKVHDLLKRRGVEVTYSTLYRFAVKHCGFGDKPSTVLIADVAPGELAEIDFGRLGLIQDGLLGRRRVLWALVVTLVHSRHQYVHVTHSQKLADVIGGLEDAWEFFGGVTARVVTDYVPRNITERVVCGVAKRFRQRPVERSRGPASWAYGDCSRPLAGWLFAVGRCGGSGRRPDAVGMSSSGGGAGGNGGSIAG